MSPWLFGYADEGANAGVPLVVIGVAAVFLGLTTKQASGYRYGRLGAGSSAQTEVRGFCQQLKGFGQAPRLLNLSRQGATADVG